MNIRDQLKAAVRALLAQGAFGMNAGGGCAYLTTSTTNPGISCVVGLMLRDHHAVTADKLVNLKGGAETAVRQCVRRGWVDADTFSPEDRVLMAGAQQIHDMAATHMLDMVRMYNFELEWAKVNGRATDKLTEPTMRQALGVALAKVTRGLVDGTVMNLKMPEAISIYEEVLAEPQPEGAGQ